MASFLIPLSAPSCTPDVTHRECFRNGEHPIYFCCINKSLVLALSPLHAYMVCWESRYIINRTFLITLGVNRFPWEGDTVLTSVWHLEGIRRMNIHLFDWHLAWKAAENCIEFTETVESLQRLWLEHIMGVYLLSARLHMLNRSWKSQGTECVRHLYSSVEAGGRYMVSKDRWRMENRGGWPSLGTALKTGGTGGNLEKTRGERGHGRWQQGVIFFLASVCMAQRLLFLMVRHIFRWQISLCAPLLYCKCDTYTYI